MKTMKNDQLGILLAGALLVVGYGLLALILTRFH
jgi:hypothetical protein